MLPLIWVPLYAASSVAFWLLQWRLSPRLCRTHFPTYASTRLTDAQRHEWDSRVVSTAHALLAVIVWLLAWTVRPACLFDDPERVGGNCGLVSAAFMVMAGYMLADAASMLAYMSWREMGPYQLHHCVALLALLACAWQGTLHYFALFRLATEMSTPLLNLMWFFRITDYRKVAPGANALNSAALTITFACCRILPIPVYWLRVATFMSDGGFFSYMGRFPVVGPFWIVFSLVLDGLNLVWFRKLILGGLKLLRAPPETVAGGHGAPVQRDTSE